MSTDNVAIQVDIQGERTEVAKRLRDMADAIEPPRKTRRRRRIGKGSTAADHERAAAILRKKGLAP